MRRAAIVIISVAFGLGSCGAADADPAAVIEDYEAAYNSGDIDVVMELFTEESVMTGHPLGDGELRGLLAIRARFEADFRLAREVEPLRIYSVAVSGNIVTWDQTWVNDAGDEFCRASQRATVTEGKIDTYTWAEEPVPCA